MKRNANKRKDGWMDGFEKSHLKKDMKGRLPKS
jgi:hypothetical protein